MITGWASTYAQPTPSRRSHDQAHADRNLRSRSSTPEEAAEPPRRSSSDATPRPTPATHPRFLGSSAAYDPNHNVLSNPPSSDTFSSSKRLGFFTDKLSQSHHSQNQPSTGYTSNQRNAPNPTQLLHPHSHTRGDSALTVSRDPPPSVAPPVMTSLSSTSGATKAHTSPSKVRLMSHYI